MTPAHIRVLLGTLSALDTRLAAKDEGNANIRVNAWASLLAEVDPAYAMRYAQQAYQQVRDWPLQPAEILQGWRGDQAATEAASDQDHRTTDAGQRPAGPSKMHGWIRDVWAAVSVGRSWESVPVRRGRCSSGQRSRRPGNAGVRSGGSVRVTTSGAATGGLTTRP